MKTIVVTGATSGIGLAVAKAFFSLGWRVIGIGREEESCERAQKELLALMPNGETEFFAADLTRQTEAARAADQTNAYLYEKCGGRLDVLVNNAGGFRSVYALTPEGYEQQFALNHLASVLFTYKLFSCLKAANGRVLFTGSNSHKHIRPRLNDVMLEKQYNGLVAYKHTKLLTMLFARSFNARFQENGVRAYTVDPGLVNTRIGLKQTGALARFVWNLRRLTGAAPEAAAKTYVFLAASSPAPEGFYYYRCKKRAYSRYAKDDVSAERVFTLSERMCNVRF